MKTRPPRTLVVRLQIKTLEIVGKITVRSHRCQTPASASTRLGRWAMPKCRRHALVGCARWSDPLPLVTRMAKVPTDSWRDKMNSYNSLSRSAGSIRQDFFCSSPASVNQRLISRNLVPGSAKSSKSCQQRDQIILEPTISDCNPRSVESRISPTSPCRPNQPKG